MDKLTLRIVSELAPDFLLAILYFTCVIISLMFRRRFPLACWLTISAIGLVMLTSVAMVFLRNYLTGSAQEYGWSKQQLFTILGTIGIAGRIVFGAALALLMVAIFSGRSHSALPVTERQKAGQEAEAQPINYAGFWKRVAAAIVDLFVLNGIGVIMGLIAVLSITFVFHIKDKNLLLMMFIVSAAISGALCGWIYFATMESSPAQATLGKMALSIKVVDTSCNRISFKRASGRFFGKFVSALFIFIGFVISGFSRKKQAFHDIMAHCMVIKETSP